MSIRGWVREVTSRKIIVRMGVEYNPPWEEYESSNIEKRICMGKCNM
jgi:hypothetical protein